MVGVPDPKLTYKRNSIAPCELMFHEKHLASCIFRLEDWLIDLKEFLVLDW
jgi:hypothetical protein